MPVLLVLCDVRPFTTGYQFETQAFLTSCGCKLAWYHHLVVQTSRAIFMLSTLARKLFLFAIPAEHLFFKHI